MGDRPVGVHDVEVGLLAAAVVALGEDALRAVRRVGGRQEQRPAGMFVSCFSSLPSGRMVYSCDCVAPSSSSLERHCAVPAAGDDRHGYEQHERCGESRVPVLHRMPPVKALYAAFAQGDIPTVLAGMAPDIAWSEAEGNPYEEPSGAPWIGADAIVENVFMELGTEWDGFGLKPERFHDAGQTVVSEGRCTGTFIATGVPVDAQYCHVFTFDGDKLASFQHYTDTGQYQKAMGQ